MPSTTSLLSVIILVVTLMCVLAFAFAEQMVRYVYLQQISEKIARTQEAISVGVWHSKTIVVAEVKNIGGKGVLIKNLKFIIGCRVKYETSKEKGTRVVTVIKMFNNIPLHPYKSKYLVFDVTDDAIKAARLPEEYVKDITINYIAVIAATEKNVFIFDPAPPTTATVLEINGSDVGKGFNIVLPNGKIAQVKVYEYLFCSIGDYSRLDTYIGKVGDITKVLVAYSPDFTSVRQGMYQFDYDYDKKLFPTASIDITPYTEITLKNGKKVNVTICKVSVPGYALGGRLLTISRGIILLGTQLSGYDIVAVTFVKTPYPKYIDPSQIPNYKSTGVTIEPLESTAYVNKIPLPSTDISVFDFLGPQVTPVNLRENMDKKFMITIGNYYSQAILIGQAFIGFLSGNGDEVEAYVEFEKPYPIIVIIAPPSVEPAS